LEPAQGYKGSATGLILPLAVSAKKNKNQHINNLKQQQNEKLY
jgi:hypothetical protein